MAGWLRVVISAAAQKKVRYSFGEHFFRRHYVVNDLVRAGVGRISRKSHCNPVKRIGKNRSHRFLLGKP
jgi:hypothetical protein